MESDTDDVAVARNATINNPCRVSIGDSRSSSPCGDKSVDVSRDDVTRSSHGGVSCLSNRDSVELMTVDCRHVARTRKQCCGCLRKVCEFDEGAAAKWTCCRRRTTEGALISVMIRVALVVLTTASVCLILGLVLSSTGEKLTISGQVTVTENAFESFKTSSSQVLSLPSELMNEICLPNNFIAHSFEFQLGQLLKHCETGRLESTRVSINESDSSLHSTAVFELVFARSYRVAPSINSTDGATSLLVEVRRLLAKAASSGNFGIFVLDLNSLNMTIETEPIYEIENNTGLSVPGPSMPPTSGLTWVCYNLPSASHQTCFPNVLGHGTLSEAESQVAGFLSRLFQTTGSVSTCSEHLSEFTCQLYLPQCTTHGRPLAPCRSYCLVVFKECPDIRDLIDNVTHGCELLPDSNDPAVCLTYPHSDVPVNCRPVEQEECHQRGFVTTAFPNSIGHSGPRTANHDWNKMVYIDKAVSCSEHLIEFSCAIVYPNCSVNDVDVLQVVGPCRSLCEVVKRDCGFFLSMSGLRAITRLNCSELPQSGDVSICIGGHVNHSSGPRHQHSTCYVDEFTCEEEDSFRCISTEWVCDGRWDCDSGADERDCATCAPGIIACGNGWCPPVDAVCNGVANCRDMDDERSCLKSTANHSDDRGAGKDESFIEIFDAAESSWLKVCLDSGDWSAAMQKHFCLTPPFIPSKSSLGVVAEHQQLLQLLKNRSDCSRYPPVKTSCNYTECIAQSTSRLLLQTASTTLSRDLFIDAPDWPWMVSLHGGPQRIFFCGASVLNAHWLLTAAHCVGSLTADDQWTVMGGHSRRVAYDVDRQVRSVSNVVVHPEFSAYAMHNDIALLRVDRPFQFGTDLQPLCLPPVGYSPTEGTRCYIGGWGKNSHRDPGYSLQARLRALTVFSRTSCERNYISDPLLDDVTNDDRLFCTLGKPGIDVCHGDSGSAVMCEHDDDDGVDNMTSSSLFPPRSRLILAGVVSYGFDSDCGVPDIPSAHTAVPAYITWIRDVIAGTGSGSYSGVMMTSSSNALTAKATEKVAKVFGGRQR